MSSATIRIDQSPSFQPDARPPSGTPSRPSSGKPRWCSAVGARSMIRLVVVTTLPAENRLPTAINVGCVSCGPSPPCIPQSRRTASSFSAKRTAIAVTDALQIAATPAAFVGEIIPFARQRTHRTRRRSGGAKRQVVSERRNDRPSDRPTAGAASAKAVLEFPFLATPNRRHSEARRPASR